VLIGLIVFLTLQVLVLDPALLVLAGRLLRARRATFVAALLASLAVVGFALVAGAATLLLPAFPHGAAGNLALAGVIFVAAVVIVRFLLSTAFWRAAGIYALRTVAVVAVALILRAFAVEAFLLPTGSMEPTLLPGDRVLVDKTRYRRTVPQRGDVVVFRSPRDGELKYTKRIAAVAGDQVVVRRGYTYVNSSLYPSRTGPPVPALPYLPSVEYVPPTLADPNWPPGRHPPQPGEMPIRSEVEDQGPFAVPSGCVYVVGDDQARSLDSRHFGFVKVADLVGRVELIYASADSATGQERWWRVLQTVR